MSHPVLQLLPDEEQERERRRQRDLGQLAEAAAPRAPIPPRRVGQGIQDLIAGLLTGAAGSVTRTARAAAALPGLAARVPVTGRPGLDLTMRLAGTAETASEAIRENLARREEAIRQATPKTTAGQIGQITGALAEDIAQIGLSGVAGRLAGISRLGPVARGTVAATPLTARAAIGPEESTVGLLAEVTGRPELQAIAEDPVARTASEFVLDALLGTVIESGVRGVRAARGLAPDIATRPEVSTQAIDEVLANREIQTPMKELNLTAGGLRREPVVRPRSAPGTPSVHSASDEAFQTASTQLVRPGGFVDPRAITAGKNRLVAFFRRNLTSAGDFPKPIFERKITRDGWINSQMRQITFTGRKFKDRLREVYGRRGPSDADLELIDAGLKSEQPLEALPDALRPVVRQMRQEIDALSQRLIDSGIVEGDLAATVTDNLGVYATRSYRIHADPDWVRKIPVKVRNKAKAYLRGEFPKVPESRIEVMINELLYVGEQADSPIALLARGRKFGSKDLSILKRRKDIAPEIRALWGEFKDPAVNYTRSVTKMAHLIGNHEFLSEVRDRGLGEFFFNNRINQDLVQFAAEGSRVLEPLNGLWTTPEIAQAFRDALEPRAMPDLFRLYMGINSTVKFTKTVGSLMTHVRNTIGNTGFAVANGHWRAGKGLPAIRAVLANVGVTNDQAYQQYYRKMLELGVVAESARAGELREAIQDAIGRGLDDPSNSFMVRSIKKGAALATDVYRAEDDVWKVFAFENEVARYSKALRGAPREEIERRAARIVRNTYPTYSLVPRGVRLLRRFPLVGTFVSFPSEVFRVGHNTLRLAAEELANPALRGIGAQRLAGLATAIGIVPAMTAASRFINGVDKKADRDVRRFLPEWSENSNLLFTSRPDDGKFEVIDFSYTDPWSYLRKPLIALTRGENWEEGMMDAMLEAAEPFVSEEIFAGKLIDIARNRTDDGREIFNPEASIPEQAQARLNHVLDALEPGTVSSAQRIVKGIGGKAEPWGQRYDPKIESIAIFTGHRLTTVDVPRQLGRNARRFQRRTSDAQRILTSVAARKNVVADDELEAAYRRMEQQRQRIWQSAREDIEAANRLGMTMEQIEKILQGSGLSRRTVRDLIRGVYRSYEPSNQFLKRVARQARAADPAAPSDFDRRRRLIREFRNTGQPEATQKNPIERLLAR